MTNKIPNTKSQNLGNWSLMLCWSLALGHLPVEFLRVLRVSLVNSSAIRKKKLTGSGVCEGAAAPGLPELFEV
jgi:hypothetical protein